jgi:heme exporter protein B
MNEKRLDPFSALKWAALRDLRLAARSRAEVLLILVFFVLIASLFPLATSPISSLLQQIGPGITWVSALLAILLSLPRLFANDFADGTLEQMVLAPAPLPAIVAGKVLAHWLTNCLPLVILTPLIGMQFALDPQTILTLTLSLLLGTPILVWLGAMMAALTLGARGGGALLGLLMLPLTAPVLIFGAGAVSAQAAGIDTAAYLGLLVAGSLITCVVGPFVTAASVRMAQE